MKKVIIGWIFSLSLYTTQLAAQDKEYPDFRFRGYLKEIISLGFPGHFDSTDWVNLIHNRLNFRYDFSSHFYVRAEIRNRLFFGSEVSETPEFGNQIDQYPGVFDLSVLWINQPGLVLHSVADRLHLTYHTSKWDLTLGRQRINWGLNSIWNPNDIFNAYNFLDFDYEERPGNDAVRVQFFPGSNKRWDLSVKPGKGKDETIAALLYLLNASGYDIQFMGGLYNTDLVIGGGWAGSLGNTGFKGEVSYFHPKKNITDTSGTLSASLMVDRSFEGNWYLSGSFLYNGNPTGYLSGGGIFSQNLSAKSLFPFRYNFYVGAMKNFNPLFSGNLSLVYSPTDHTFIFFPVIALNAGTNLDFDLTIQSFFSKFENKYQSRGTALYLRGKWSF